MAQSDMKGIGKGPASSTLLRRLGWEAQSILIATTIVVLAVAGFIAFLWFADLDNNVWHQIMVTDWATRAVTISTLVLRFVIDLQAGLAGAMLATVVLESSSVKLRDVAEISMMRANSPQPRAMLRLIPALSDNSWVFPSLSSIGYSAIVLLLFSTTTVLQFSSTLLLSDLQLGQLPGLSVVREALYDFQYEWGGPASFAAPASHRGTGYSYPIQLRTSTWLRPPPAFPAFAELSSPVESPEGVEDTGVLLRAFLPFPDAQSRQSIRNYSGPAMVLDSRVSCQRPHLTHIKTLATSEAGSVGRISGKLEPSFPDVDKLWTPASLAPWFDSYANNGGLLSEFWNITHNNMMEELLTGRQLWSLPMLVIRPSNITKDAVSEDVLGIEADGVWTNIITRWQTWSLSVCYSAFATVDAEVNMFSDANRTEPIVHWDLERGYYTVPDVHHQMGELQSYGSSAESRGILRLEKKPSWIPKLEYMPAYGVQPFVQQFVDVTNTYTQLCKDISRCTALLTPNSQDHKWFYQNYVYDGNQFGNGFFVADYMLSSLFQQTLGKNTTDSLARAMSSLITVLSSMAYYDQMPQFARSGNATQTYYTTVLFPQTHLGFWCVAIVLATHLALVGLVTVGFMMYSKHTLLNNHWQSVAQLHGPETEELIVKTRMATDHDVKKALSAAGHECVRVGVRALKPGYGEVGMRIVREKDRLLPH
ncbi:hypothetical protein LTR37_006486 [Vermiconidia calcicola]|uniref:Uncharacterized protein n=1 Tax=Vermiconidia calcicola TaxID=1690605 RepID=A0ACC3NFZ4_9PEZI|nr:hypothetical protein LTR37_006486 [Vermiconidia calcicola]